MRKLIETSQENEVVCDNPLCDFAIKNKTNDIYMELKLRKNNRQRTAETCQVNYVGYAW